MIAKRRPCPCCGNLTMDDPHPGSFQICPVCFWEDDPVQLDDPSYEGGANAVSLEQARRGYREHGASEARFLGHVRAPRPDEIPSR